MILDKIYQKKTHKSYDKIVTDRTLKKAVKESIEDQERLSKKAAQLRAQTTVR